MHRHSPDRLRLLVVDDDELDRALITRALERSELDCSVVTATTLAEAEAVLSSQAIDCVLTDLMLQDGEGIELLRLGHAAAMVVVTASPIDRSRSALVAGAQDWFRKTDVTPGALARSVRFATLRRRASIVEGRARATDRFAAVGQLAGALAHELNNPGTAVLGSLETLQHRLDAERLDREAIGELRAITHDALEAMERIARVTRGLASYAHIGAPDVERELDVHEVVRQAIDVVRPSLGNVELSTSVAPIPVLRGDGGAITEILVSMLMTVGERGRDAEDACMHLEVFWSDDRLQVSLIGNGEPFPEPLRGMPMNPFVHVQASEAGVGFGLWMADEATARVGGRLHFGRDRAPEMVLELPAAVASGEARGDVEMCTVLMIDDQPLIYQQAARLLRGSCMVVGCESAAEAQQWLRHNEPDIVLLDLVMPEIDGTELFGWLERHRPELVERLVFVTAGAFTPEAQALLRRAQRPVLLKPLTRAGLEDTIARMLEG